MGLGFTGVGLASFAFAPLFQYLVEAYAWRGALLVLGGLSFNMIACGALIRPLGKPKVEVKVCVLIYTVYSKYYICIKYKLLVSFSRGVLNGYKLTENYIYNVAKDFYFTAGK